MPGKDLTFFERLKGKRFGDIELENESGEVDPRLKGKSGEDRGAAMRKGLDKLQSMRALREAAKSKEK